MSVLTTSNTKIEFSLASVFTNNMVLQRETAVCIWGCATPNTEVIIEFDRQIKNILSDSNGDWKTFLDPMPANHSAQVLMARNEGACLFVDNVCVGEVWVCSGQSNMGWSLELTTDAIEDLKYALNPSIRFLVIPTIRAATPQHKILSSTWLPCHPDHCRNWSGVAYHFAIRLFEELKVPIGIIWASLGATKIQEWTSQEINELHNYDIPEEWNTNPKSELFNGMIAPVIPYTIQGVAWYQGEENHCGAGVYETQFSAMIEDWRNRWQQGSFPFIYVQISAYGETTTLPYSTWAELQEAQLKTLAHPNTAMVISVDVGERDDIHPQNKKTVGYRLAIAALGRVYNRRDVFTGPLYREISIQKDYIKVYFDQVGQGLQSSDGKPLRWFEVAAEPIGETTPIFYPAEVKIQTDHLLVLSEKVTNPTRIRYAYNNNPEGCNLVNSEGLPASPFRSSNDCSYSIGLNNKKRLKQRPIALHQRATTTQGETIILDLSGRWSFSNWYEFQKIEVVQSPNFGKLSINGSLATYESTHTEKSTDGFTYKIFDGVSESNVATVIIDLQHIS